MNKVHKYCTNFTMVFAMVFFLASHNGYSQSFFETASLQGWKGSGQLMGKPASFQMHWEAILDGKFYKLTFRNQQDEAGSYVFQAMGIYQPHADGTFTGTWFDSRGITFPLHGTFSAKGVSVRWGDPEIEEGKTDYVLHEDGHISVTDYIRKNDQLVSFGTADYVSEKE